MLLGVDFDAFGAEGQQTVFVGAEIGDFLVRMESAQGVDHSPTDSIVGRTG